jgi:PleD family two-component response regulator
LADATVIAERLRIAISRCNLPMNDERLNFTVSVGTTQVHDEQETDDLLATAQVALDKSRAAGGNRCYANDEKGELSSLTPQGVA